MALPPRTRDGILRVDDPMIKAVIGDTLAIANVAALPVPIILGTSLCESKPWALWSFSHELCCSL